MKRPLALLPALALAFLVLLAAPAFAHASLVTSDPETGSVLATSPKSVRLTFDEPVETNLGAVQVLDRDGKAIAGVGKPQPGTADGEVTAALPPLANGSYVIVYRVVSADSHPTSGAIPFSVGEANATADDLLERAGGAGGQAAKRDIGFALGVARFATFASIVVLIGAGTFLASTWPAGVDRRGSQRLLTGAWALALLATLAGVAVQGAYASGDGWGAVWSPSRWVEVLDTRFGHAALVRVGCLLVLSAPLLVALARLGARVERSSEWRAGWGVAGFGLLTGIALGGHATTGRAVPFGFVVDIVHLGAISLWLGGLVVLAVLALPRASTAELSSAVPAFSSTALVSMIAIVVTGIAQSLRQVADLSEFASSTYGRLVLAKVLVVGAIVLLAAAARSLLRSRTIWRVPATVGSMGIDAPADRAPERRRLGRLVMAEAALAVGVLGLTANLVATPPPQAEAASLPFNTSRVVGNVLVDITLTPARKGLNQLHLTVASPTGALIQTQAASARLRLPARDIGPIEVPLKRDSANHFIAMGVQIPYSGTWNVELRVQTGEAASVTTSFDVNVS